MRAIGIIPARYKSTRLDGKPLADIHGKPMIRLVYEQARKANLLSDVFVATDDQRIVQAVADFGGKAVLTSGDHRSGTDRVAEAAASVPADVIVNIQGDEPMIDPLMIDEVVEPFLAGTPARFVTLKKEVFHESEFSDPGVVKVVTGYDGRALYFSRSLIPHPRNRTPHFRVFEHVGLYAYTRECLLEFARLPLSPLEEIESLEQLRALENGIPILVVATQSRVESISVDTPADLERVREALRLR